MKGQTAIEYLMTYGWAILIILIVAGVLAYYGIFAPAGFLGPSARGFSTVAVVTPWDFNAAGTLRVNLENRVGTNIRIQRIIMGTGTTPDTLLTLTPAAPISVAAGGRSDFITGTGGPTGSTGATYTISVAIEYDIGGTDRFNSTGTLSGTRS